MNDDDQKFSDRAELFLGTLRRSSELAQDLLRQISSQKLRLTSLQGELADARSRIRFLEQETQELRAKLPGGPNDDLAARLEALAEEQNALAHLFVTSDRFARVRSHSEAVQAAAELLHNLVGARSYGLWLRWRRDDRPLLVTSERSDRVDTAPFRELVTRCLDTGQVIRPAAAPPDSVPSCHPIRLESEVVGALLVESLVPQVGNHMGRLQIDLVDFVCDRFATSLCIGMMSSAASDRAELWDRVREHVREFSRG